MSKAACITLALAIPGFLGYPAELNVDQRKKVSPQLVEGAKNSQLWPVPTVVSLQSRFPIVQSPAAKFQPVDGELLTKELQRQLRRVGCYAGEVNGVWTQSTRRAMHTFANRVNAILPTNHPDRMLLAILQSHSDKTCKAPCPVGESRSSEGYCVPGAIVGLSPKITALYHGKSVPPLISWTSTAPSEDNEPNVFNGYGVPLTAPAAPAAPSRRVILTSPAVPKNIGPARPEAPKISTAPSKRLPQRPTVAASREQSRTSQQSDFVRTFFQRLDGSGR
jgi:peptidoglycan hydrolase-like protein with peptidoglycan-binding domain